MQQQELAGFSHSNVSNRSIGQEFDDHDNQSKGGITDYDSLKSPTDVESQSQLKWKKSTISESGDPATPIQRNGILNTSYSVAIVMISEDEDDKDDDQDQAKEGS